MSYAPPAIDTTSTGPFSRRLAFWLFSRLAIQNLGRRPTRTFLLIFAVALGSAAVFATLTVARGIQASMDVRFSRMGADLMVVPRDTLVNLTSALLTAEPTSHTLPASLADTVTRIRGVRRVAPQRHYRVPTSFGGHNHEASVVAFDPDRDFCVLPWIKETLDRPLGKGDILLGAGQEGKVGETLLLCGQSLTIYGRLDRTTVGPFDNAFFITFQTADLLADGGGSRPGSGLPGYDPDRISALLVQLAVGATPEQVRFAVGQTPGVKVAAGGSILTSSRQGLTALLGGIFACAALLLLGSVVLVSVLFSAIIAERQREVGLLRAVGARRGQIVRLFVTEAGFTTGLGGLCGIALGGGLLLLFERSLGYYFQTVNVPFLWPGATSIAWNAAGCALGAGLVGVFGALLPGLRAGRREPYDLIHAEGK
jgi:putative ABC transport system permease protein